MTQRKPTFAQKVSSIIRLSIGLVWIGAVVATCVPFLILFLPSRKWRIWTTNVAGTLIGGGLIRVVGGWKVDIKGREKVSRHRPAIYVGNHIGVVDAFTSIWLSPIGTVGTGKKELLYYPFYGQLWWLSGHLTLDRGKSTKAIRAMNKMAEIVKKNGLHICIFPEGTRSRDGRLRRFKKGFVHLAIQTGLPLIPMVSVDADKIWPSDGPWLYRDETLKITFLDPIDTSDWKVENATEHADEVFRIIADALPERHKPLPEVAEAAGLLPPRKEAA